ncbi:MAG: thioredoxin family protein, partial [Bacteroidetes bacterium]
GKLAYPATVFLDSDLSFLTNVPGYRGPQDMMAFLSYFHQEKYKDNISLQSYLDNYGKAR